MFPNIVVQLEHFFEEAVVRVEWQLILLAIVIIVGPYLAERVRLPGLIGLVLGGLLIGPYGLHLLPAGALDAIGGIGLLFLMFIAGAELDLNLFQRYRSTAFAFGLLTFIFPFVLGALASFFIGMAAAAAILMGSVWASHTLVAYPQVRQAGLATNKSVAVTVSATVITDTLALLVLAVISGTHNDSGGDPLQTLLFLLMGLGLLALWCLVILPRLARWFYAGLGQERILRFVFVVGALASAGFLATLVGIEGIVGAFFAGLGLNRLIPNNGRLMEAIEFFASSLFIPAFLVMVGMLIDPGVLFNLNTLFIAALFLAALAIGKISAAYLGGKRSKFDRAEIMLMFSLTIAQAAATLAATIVGFEIGLFSQQIVNAVLLVVMVSLIISTVGTERATRHIKPEAMLLKPLGKAVVVPIGPANSLEPLMDLAAGIAYQDAGVVNPLVIVPEDQAARMRPQAEKLLHQAEEFGQAATADVEGELRVDASVAQGIVRELHESESTLLLAEIPQRATLSSFFFGTVIDHFGSRTPIPSAAVHLANEPIKRIVLVPGPARGGTGYRVDLQVAVDVATRLAKSKAIPLRVLATEGKVPAELDLPADTECVTVARGIDAVRDAMDAGDLAIVPCETMRATLRLNPSRSLASAQGVSILVAAGPYRLQLGRAPVKQDVDAIMNFGGAAA